MERPSSSDWTGNHRQEVPLWTDRKRREHLCQVTHKHVNTWGLVLHKVWLNSPVDMFVNTWTEAEPGVSHLKCLSPLRWWDDGGDGGHNGDLRVQ